MTSLRNTSKNTRLPIDNSPLSDEEKLANESLNVQENGKNPWYKGVFKKTQKENPREPKLLEQVNILISDNPAKVADVCEKYISLHRIVENTKARRRLEKWITRLIVWYLIVVGSILLLSSLSVWLADNGYPNIFISDKIMVVLLSTTTVNIVALGIILAKGLFHEHEKEDVKKEDTKK